MADKKAYVAIPGNGPTPSGKVNFNCVFEVDDKGKYSLMLVFKKSQSDEPAFKNMVAALNEAAREEFDVPNGYRDPVKGNALKNPFKTSDHYDYIGEDEVAVRLKSKFKPQVLDADGETYLEDDTDFYSGCLARATYSATAYDVDGNRGVQLQLNNLQKTGAGKRFSNRKKAHEEFGAVEQDESLQDMPGESGEAVAASKVDEDGDVAF